MSDPKTVDKYGRVYIPKKLRRRFGLKEGSIVEMQAHEDGIILKMNKEVCFICGSTEKLAQFKDKHLCPEHKEYVEKFIAVNDSEDLETE